MKTMEGTKLHQDMMQKASDILREQGYETLFRAKLPNYSGATIDVVGIKGDEKIGIECQIIPQKRIITEKIKHYTPHLTKLIFAFPENVRLDATLFPNIEILRLPFSYEKKKKNGDKLTIIVDRQLGIDFRVAVAKRGGKRGDLTKALEEAMKLWLQQQSK